MKCRDNLRGAVIKHWKRHTIAIAGKDESNNISKLPIYMRTSVWKRTNPTSEQDHKVNTFLQELYEAETELKRTEKKLRVEADYCNVIGFLSQIDKLRAKETSFRSDLLSMLQDLLGERDIVLQNEKIAVSEAREAKCALKELQLKELATSHFRSFQDIMYEDRVLENVRTNVLITHRQNDIRDLEKNIQDLRLAHMKREGELLLNIERLEDELGETKERLGMTMENLGQTRFAFDANRSKLEKTTRAFDKYRIDAEKYTKQTLEEFALEETKHHLYSTIAAAASTRVKELDQELLEQKACTARNREACERWQMKCADLESLVINVPESDEQDNDQEQNSQDEMNSRPGTAASTASKKRPTSSKGKKSKKKKKGGGKRKSTKISKTPGSLPGSELESESELGLGLLDESTRDLGEEPSTEGQPKKSKGKKSKKKKSKAVVLDVDSIQEKPGSTPDDAAGKGKPRPKSGKKRKTKKSK